DDRTNLVSDCQHLGLEWREALHFKSRQRLPGLPDRMHQPHADDQHAEQFQRAHRDEDSEQNVCRVELMNLHIRISSMVRVWLRLTRVGTSTVSAVPEIQIAPQNIVVRRLSTHPCAVDAVWRPLLGCVTRL